MKRTGLRRYRIQKQLFGPDLLVLQILIEYSLWSAKTDKYIKARKWVDARVQDVSITEVDT